MALTSSANRITYLGDNSTVAFALPYLVYDATHVQVYLAGILQSTGYTVSGVGDSSGVTVTFTPAPALNVEIILQRVVPLTQLAIYDVAGAFPAKTTEKNFDLTVMRAQQHETARLRSLRQPDGDAANISTIPLLAARANKYLTFDSSGNPTATDAATASGTSVLATGSTTARLLADRFADWVNVKDFGAVLDGVTNDAAAFQAAHDALPSNGGTIYIPGSANSSVIGAQVDFIKDVRLLGTGYRSSVLTTATNALVMFTTTKKLIIDDCGFTATGAAIDTAIAVKTLSSASNHGETMLRGCYFDGFTKCYWSQRTAALYVVECRFAPGSYGLYLENLTSSDEGDSFVYNNYFAGDAGDTSIYIASTSGLNLTGNKFNGAVTAHVDIAPGANDVGNFLMCNNSFEGQTTAAIRLIGTTGLIDKVLITGNQFAADATTHIVVGQGSRYVTITGNHIKGTNAAAGIGVDIQASSLGTSIVGNQFRTLLTAIKSTGNLTRQNIHSNQFDYDVTKFYEGGENGQNLNDPNQWGSVKSFEVERYITNTSNAAYVNAFQFDGECIVEVEIMGIVQTAGSGYKYYKGMVTGAGGTVTDLIALVSVGSTFDSQVVASGGVILVGIKRNGATGSSVDMQVKVKVTGYVRDLIKV